MRGLATLLYVVLVFVGVLIWLAGEGVGALYQWMVRIKGRYAVFLASVYEWTL
jgi:hypothetical protein